MASRKKKNKGEEDTGGGLLEVMTISLFIILLAFFILLNSIAVTNDTKVVKAIGSLLGSFGGPSGGNSLIKGTGNKPILPVFKPGQGQIDFSDLFIGGKDLDQEIKTKDTARGSVVSIPMDILFLGQEIKLKKSGISLLSRLLRIVKANAYPLEISGNTSIDRQEQGKATGDYEFSALRAMSIMKYFLNQGHVKSSRLTAYGFGSSRPAYSNDTIQTRAMNQRIDVLFVHKKKLKKPERGFTFKNFFFKSFH